MQLRLRVPPAAAVVCVMSFVLAGACGEVSDDSTSATDEEAIEATEQPAETPGASRNTTCPAAQADLCDRLLAEIQRSSGAASEDDVKALQDVLLQRPLELPRVNPEEPCPVTPVADRWPTSFTSPGRGVGPVFVFIPAYIDIGVTHPSRTGGIAVQTVYIADDSYQGPFVVRGRQVDGPTQLRFLTEDSEPSAELRFGVTSQMQTENNPGGWRLFGGPPLVEHIGCYALQIDGPNFSELVIFQVLYCDFGACIHEEELLPNPLP